MRFSDTPSARVSVVVDGDTYYKTDWMDGRIGLSDCWRRRHIDPVCRFHVTQRDDLEPVGGLGIAVAKGGSVKSRRLGQICVGTNKLDGVAIKSHSVA